MKIIECSGCRWLYCRCNVHYCAYYELEIKRPGGLVKVEQIKKCPKINKTNKNLTLVLEQRWYSMYLSGEKKEEYRKCNAFWLPRFFTVKDQITGEERKMTKDEARTYACSTESVKRAIADGILSPIPYKTATLHRAYTKIETFRKVTGMPRIGFGNAKWGAPKEEVIIIPIGDQID